MLAWLAELLQDLVRARPRLALAYAVGPAVGKALTVGLKRVEVVQQAAAEQQLTGIPAPISSNRQPDITTHKHCLARLRMLQGNLRFA